MKKLLVSGLSLLFSSLVLAQPPQGGQPRSMADAFMMQLDSNKDGKVSKEEFMAPHERRFAKIDKNGDGAVDRAEIEALEKSMREHMERMRRQQPPASQK